jgi:hypothetical protein
VKGLLLAALVAVLALPAAATASPLPVAPDPAASSPQSSNVVPGAQPTDASAPCDSPSCASTQDAANVQQVGAPGTPRTTTPSGENERIADYFMLALLVSFLLIVPVIVTRQRMAREASGPPAPQRPVVQLIWSRDRRSRN